MIAILHDSFFICYILQEIYRRILIAKLSPSFKHTWKKILAFWASELGNQNPSADFLRNIRYKEGIMKNCNHYSIKQKEFLLPAAEILL